MRRSRRKGTRDFDDPPVYKKSSSKVPVAALLVDSLLSGILESGLFLTHFFDDKQTF